MQFDFSAIRLSIAPKAVLLIAGLGVLSAVANWFCLQRIDDLDRMNNMLASHVSPARLALAEAKAGIETFGIATYKTMALANIDSVREAAAAIDGSYSAGKNSLNNVRF